MPIYQFEAMDTSGSEVKDAVEAPSEEEAQQKIKQLGYFVTKITEVADGKKKSKAPAKRKKKGKAFTTTVIDSFRPLITLFKKLLAKTPPKAGEAKPEANAEPQAHAKEESIIDIIHSLEADPDLPRQSETSIDLESLEEIQDVAPIRRLLNMVMLLAIRDRASDIHFEPFEDEYKMRYRCDGVLYEMVPPPRHLATEIADRIKVMAHLDTAERRLPQHGRIELNVGDNPVDMRVSVLPTMFGESVVIHVFDRFVVSLDLNKVGMDQQILRQFRQLIHKPNGIILVTGPIGAGKTTTLYSALNELNEITDKIITAEDPVECEIDGVVHCQIHDLTSTDAVRFLLGQAPDIIGVGEIRDHVTAQIAVQAALSGRLVLSTLDADDAAASITRLRGMGLEPSMITATMKAILAQRLVRKICADCRTEFEPSPEMLMELNLRPQDVEGKQFYYGRGCERCNNSGYKGRRGIFELVTMNDVIRDLISGGASTDQLRQACVKQDMRILRDAGLEAMFNGVTTIDEVARETVFLGQDPDPSPLRPEDHHRGSSRNGIGG